MKRPILRPYAQTNEIGISEKGTQAPVFLKALWVTPFISKVKNHWSQGRKSVGEGDQHSEVLRNCGHTIIIGVIYICQPDILRAASDTGDEPKIARHKSLSASMYASILGAYVPGSQGQKGSGNFSMVAAFSQN